jgi:PDZ domain
MLKLVYLSAMIRRERNGARVIAALVAGSMTVATTFAHAQPTAAAPTTAAAPATGTVTIEQGNRSIATGTVLLADGRILTAVRLEGPDRVAAADVMIRYEDGFRVPGRVMHHDRHSGLALVVPLEGRRKEGEVASETNPLVSPIRLAEGRRDKRVILRLPNPSETVSAGQEGWPYGLLVGEGSDAAMAGTALIDERGHVAGIRTNRCALVANSKVAGGIDVRCTFPAVASVAAIRGFLLRTPTNAVQPPAWLGIAGQTNDGATVRGVRVMAVAPKSPAAVAGLQSDVTLSRADVIATVDGLAVTTPETLAEAIAKYAPGDRVKLVVFSGVRSREVAVVLRAAP